MQHVGANDYMTGSAKRAIDAALRDARSRVVGSAGAEGLPEGRAAAGAAAPPTTPADPASGSSA